jgi:hypothetical protein
VIRNPILYIMINRSDLLFENLRVRMAKRIFTGGGVDLK